MNHLRIFHKNYVHLLLEIKKQKANVLKEISSYQEQTLAKALLSKNYVTADQLNVALSEQKSTNQPLDGILIDMGYMCPMVLQKLKSENSGLPFVDLRKICEPSKKDSPSLPLQLCTDHCAFPFHHDNTHISIAMYDPENTVPFH